MTNLRYVTSKELGQCPASVEMDSGLIDINVDVWDRYNDFQRSFIIEHEIGHYELQTDDEALADTYALKKLYGSVNGSLKKSLETLFKIGIVDNDRLTKLYIEALKIDAFDNNNENAIKELENLGITKMNKKQTVGSNPFLNQKKNRADGKTAENKQSGHEIAQALKDKFMSESSAAAQSKKTGISIGNYFFSYEAILMALMIVLMLRK